MNKSLKKALALLLSVLFIFSCMQCMFCATAAESAGLGAVWSYDAETKTLTIGLATTTAKSGVTEDVERTRTVPVLDDEGNETGETKEETYTETVEIDEITYFESGKMTDYETTSDVPWTATAADATTIVIEDGITNIGDRSFYNLKNVTTVIIPSTVTTIGVSAFNRCASLTTIETTKATSKKQPRMRADGTGELKDANGNVLYSDRPVYEVVELETADGTATVPSSVTSISSSAFRDCTSLKGFTIPDTVTTLPGDYHFFGDSALTTVTVGKGVETVPASSFASCSTLEKVTLNNGVKAIAANAFSDDVALKSIALPSTVESIGVSAFSNCSAIEEIAIPESVNLIEDMAFTGCSSLKSITLGDNVTTLATSVFENCTSLASITVSDNVDTICANAIAGTAYYKDQANWKDGVLYLGNHIIAVDGNAISGDVTLPATTKCIADSAFANCDNLTGITITGATGIGKNAFIGCENLKTADVTAEYIGEAAFKNCTALTDVTIGDGCQSIKREAFENDEALKTISMPASLTYIGNDAFYGCFALESVEYAGASMSDVTIARGNGSVRGAEWNCTGSSDDGNFFTKIINAIKGFFQKIIDAVKGIFNK